VQARSIGPDQQTGEAAEEVLQLVAISAITEPLNTDKFSGRSLRFLIRPRASGSFSIGKPTAWRRTRSTCCVRDIARSSLRVLGSDKRDDRNRSQSRDLFDARRGIYDLRTGQTHACVGGIKNDATRSIYNGDLGEGAEPPVQLEFAGLSDRARRRWIN
jgi:hypothetical protein